MENNDRRTEYQRKLDEVVAAMEKFTVLLKGDTTTAGFIERSETRIERLEETVNGTEKEMGIRTKVGIMWAASRVAAGVVCTAMGYLLHPYMTKLVALLK